MNTDKEQLFRQLKKLDTEQRNPNSMEIDVADSLEIARIINQEDKKVADEVEKKLPQVAKAIDAAKEAFDNDGRLIYMGAGTSGRLGILDASECPPTFGSDPEQVVGLIAGGKEAVFQAKEGAEDFEENGQDALEEIDVAPNDVVCGLAASGRTPYVVGGLKFARQIGCTTVLVTTVPAQQISVDVDILIDVPVGPEVVMGSTRMKSATAQKMVLNMITTGANIRRGKVYENVMVDLQLSNEKLHERSKRIIMMFTDLDYEQADQLLEKSDGHVKTALVMHLGEVSKKKAEEQLKKHNGFIRKALANI
ncbi:N-acetylmuramic acid 6-phosphate etherase [Fodinibius sp. Rm-B-1B1-1]|uniref:N-acetylmuramic acid 6-phosphate etherase n=1 Tax=Fodinibius alkaliphilus TaxID=3140241 RepID=UPI00315AC6E8